MREQRSNFNIDIALVAFAGLLSMIPVLPVGVPYGLQDQVHHLQIANAYYQAWTQGVAFPDWVFAENHGYGAVTVRFYPPLIHGTLAFFRIVFQDWQIAVFAAFALWSAIGNVGVWQWSRDLGFGRLQAFFAALFFSLAPYHLNQFYNSFMYGEFVSLAVIPFCFLYTKRVCENGSLRNIAALGISLVFLILANLPQLVIGLVCVGFYTLFHLERRRLPKQLFHLILSGLSALASSSFFWVRVVYEMNWLKISQPNLDPHYDYRNNFLFAVFSFDGGGVWFAGLMTALLLAIVIAALVASEHLRKTASDRGVRPILFLSIFSIFMMLPVSRPIWDVVGFLQRVQFPWRFLSTLSLTASLLFGFCFAFINRENYLLKRPQVIVLLGLAAILAAFSIKQVMLGPPVLSKSGIKEVVERSYDEIGLDHWHPVWVDGKAFDEKEKIVTDSRNVSLEKWESGQVAFVVESGEPEMARIALMYYPHWRAAVNGQSSEVTPSSDGAVTVSLPPQSSRVELTFNEPFYTTISRWISAAGAVIALLCLFAGGRRNNSTRKYDLYS